MVSPRRTGTARAYCRASHLTTRHYEVSVLLPQSAGCKLLLSSILVRECTPPYLHRVLLYALGKLPLQSVTRVASQACLARQLTERRRRASEPGQPKLHGLGRLFCARYGLSDQP